jgi:aldehyde:ferredoxin oxidoreductase
VREGFDRADDDLPERMKRPLEDGGRADGNHITEAEFQEMLGEYYELRGWTDDGVPKPDTLERLDIAEFAPAQ